MLGFAHALHHFASAMSQGNASDGEASDLGEVVCDGYIGSDAGTALPWEKESEEEGDSEGDDETSKKKGKRGRKKGSTKANLQKKKEDLDPKRTAGGVIAVKKGRGKVVGGKKCCKICKKWLVLAVFPQGSAACAEDKRIITNLQNAAKAQGVSDWLLPNLIEQLIST